MLYEREKASLNKEFEVTEEWKISNCKMKVGDILKVVDYGSGMATDYVVFENKRIKTAQFRTGTSWFLRSVKPL